MPSLVLSNSIAREWHNKNYACFHVPCFILINRVIIPKEVSAELVLLTSNGSPISYGESLSNQGEWHFRIKMPIFCSYCEILVWAPSYKDIFTITLEYEFLDPLYMGEGLDLTLPDMPRCIMTRHPKNPELLWAPVAASDKIQQELWLVDGALVLRYADLVPGEK